MHFKRSRTLLKGLETLNTAGVFKYVFEKSNTLSFRTSLDFTSILDIKRSIHIILYDPHLKLIPQCSKVNDTTTVEYIFEF